MSQTSSQNAAQNASADMPPAMAAVKSKGMDELLKEMNRMPLFMTTLDETDGEGGENIALEAIKAIAYEGTRAEVAENFREQGNECARAKQWNDAKQFYDKALAALKGPQADPGPDQEASGSSQAELDEEEEAAKEKKTEEACFVNRALCNLEKKNYRSCILDCASTLRINPSNIKAFYRSSTACLALDKLPEAIDACERGLQLDPTNAPLVALEAKITTRKAHVDSVERQRQEREAKAASERATLKLALKARNIATRSTGQTVDLEDAEIKLENPLDPSSTLSFPVLLLYPAHSQSDFVKAFSEMDTLDQHLDYIFPLPWDTENEYTLDKVDAYMETSAGGLIKVGKKMTLGKVLKSGKPEVVDGLVRVNVVPQERAAGWIGEFKKSMGKTTS